MLSVQFVYFVLLKIFYPIGRAYGWNYATSDFFFKIGCGIYASALEAKLKCLAM